MQRPGVTPAILPLFDTSFLNLGFSGKPIPEIADLKIVFELQIRSFFFH